jgi:acetyl esterase/lipase
MRRLLPLLLLLPAAAQEQKPYIHVPDTVSKEAQAYLRRFTAPPEVAPFPAPDDLDGWKRTRAGFDAMFAPMADAAAKRYGTAIEERKLGGVPVLDLKPKGWKGGRRVLVYAHGGAYCFGTARGTLGNSALAADATGLRVISIDYTLAPEARWPKVTEEAVAVLEALVQEGHPLGSIGLYGDSAGGGLAAAAALRMRDKGLGMPAALVLQSPWVDLTDAGDTLVTLRAAEPYYFYDKHLKPCADAYAEPKDQRNPLVSPVYADFAKGFPPTLIQGGTKEILLSGFVRLYQAIDGAGGTATLDLYEGMPHVFQVPLADAPEGKAAWRRMRAFLERRLAE